MNPHLAASLSRPDKTKTGGFDTMATAPRDYEHGFLPQADATAYGMTTALRRGFNGKRPRTRYTSVTKREGTSPNMLVTYADGTSRIVAASSYKATKSGPRGSHTPQQQLQNRRMMAADMAPIGNIE